jgi:hypothetical protein
MTSVCACCSLLHPHSSLTYSHSHAHCVEGKLRLKVLGSVRLEKHRIRGTCLLTSRPNKNPDYCLMVGHWNVVSVCTWVAEMYSSLIYWPWFKSCSVAVERNALVCWMNGDWFLDYVTSLKLSVFMHESSDGTRKDMRGSGSGCAACVIPAFAWRFWRKPRKPQSG